MDKIQQGILWYFVFLFSSVLHEASHSFVGMRLGDKTAYFDGQVSLNPIPHIRREIFGTVVVPILSYLQSGWMIGWASAPYDYIWAQKYPKRSGAMALAGPLANLSLTIISGLLINVGYYIKIFSAPSSITFSILTTAARGGVFVPIANLVSIFFSLNLILFLFNLLPFPPLDGSKILLLFLDDEKARELMHLMHHPGVTLIGIIIAWNIFDIVYHPIHLFSINLLYPGVRYG